MARRVRKNSKFITPTFGALENNTLRTPLLVIKKASDVTECDQAPPWTNNVTDPQQNPSYDYNMSGSSQFALPAYVPSLGLDGGGKYLAENQVKVPCDMIEVIDATPTTVDRGGDHDADDITYPLN